jgi:hypothetical protein
MSTRAVMKVLQSSTNDQIMAPLGRKGSKKQRFFPTFSMSVICLAKHKKRLMKCL